MMRQAHREDYLELDVDQLEPRQMLAGHISAQITNAGDLVINGDNLDNGVSVIFSEGEVVLEGTDGTLVNGESSDSLTIDGNLRDIRIRMKGGDDYVAMNGSGAGTIRHARVNMGTGSDTFVLGYVVATGNAIINLGGGASETSQSAVFSFSTIGGNLNVRGGATEDVVTIGFDVTVAKKTRINLSAGDDSLHILFPSASFMSSFFANGGGGNDDVVEDSGTHAITPVYRGFEFVS